MGLRYRLHPADLAGRPDIVFRSARIAVFCDGDFWHGRNWRSRRRKLARGANSEYWIAKIRANIDRDRARDRTLRRGGWTVVRVWESQIKLETESVAEAIAAAVWKARRKR